jgi:hypothetical protein
MWAVLPGDPVRELFESVSGLCGDRQRLVEQCRIPLDEPKIAMIMPRYHQVHSNVYEGEITTVSNHDVVVDEAHLNLLRQRLGSRFAVGLVGYAAQGYHDGSSGGGIGYATHLDLNDDGVIDERDEEILARNIGRQMRANLYVHAYFGGDWLTTNVCLAPEHRAGIPAIADYTYGGGYDASAGVVKLLDTPGPSRRVWIEYQCLLSWFTSAGISFPLLYPPPLLPLCQ